MAVRLFIAGANGMLATSCSTSAAKCRSRAYAAVDSMPSTTRSARTVADIRRRGLPRPAQSRRAAASWRSPGLRGRVAFRPAARAAAARAASCSVIVSWRRLVTVMPCRACQRALALPAAAGPRTDTRGSAATWRSTVSDHARIEQHRLDAKSPPAPPVRCGTVSTHAAHFAHACAAWRALQQPVQQRTQDLRLAHRSRRRCGRRRSQRMPCPRRRRAPASSMRSRASPPRGPPRAASRTTASARQTSDWRKRRKRTKSRYCSRARRSAPATNCWTRGDRPALLIISSLASARKDSPWRAACAAN